MVGASQANVAAEGFHSLDNPVIICGDDHMFDPPGFADALAHVLNQVLSSLVGERFSGEAG